MNLFIILLSALLVNNFVLVRFLGGICPFLGVSKQVESAFGMGIATTFVMVVASAATWLIQTFILDAFGLPFLQTVAFILVIASVVQLVEMFLHKTSPPGLYRAMGIFLPLITTNCAILGLAIMAVQGGYNFIETVVFALGGAGLGFTVALLLLAGIREEIAFADIPPKPLQGRG